MVIALADIEAARDRLAGAIIHTPCRHSPALSRLCGAEVFCKLDLLQATGSFKERGARNKLLLLDAGQRTAGVIAASAGNHALGLAHHGRLLGIPVTVVMPRWAPLIKVSRCRASGAEIILHGETFDEARLHAQALGSARGLAYVHGFDDAAIIAGQGTLGLEILADVPDAEAILVPVGGGGLIAGIGTAVKALRPQVEIIGVEALNAPTLHTALECGELVKITPQPTLADGLAVAMAGAQCLEIARRVVDRIVLVDETRIATAILRLMELEKTVVEGAGAVPLAAALGRDLGLDGKKIVLVLCGGNIDLTMIGHVIERGLATDGRLARLEALIPDRPGALARLLTVVAETGASIGHVHHDRNFAPADVAHVQVTCTVETRDHAHKDQLRAALGAVGIKATVTP
ncbi:MAG: threonine ammonia-lyase [Planctomycetes bacterium]|nr:threonine ammonia-lyase [Planctomycetota bacterium]